MPPTAPAPAGRRPGTHRLAPYSRLLRTPGAAAFFASGVLARLPMAMFGVAAVVMVATSRGSYALAGAVSATGLGFAAVVAPLVARAVDRLGQARVAVPAVLFAVAAHLSLAAAVRADAPDWALFCCAALASTAPNTGGMSRARWARLYRDDPAARHTANSLEQAADELCFVLGPVVAVALAVSWFPEAGTVFAAVTLLAGTLLFTAQRRTEPPVGAAGPKGRAPVRTPGMAPLLATFLATGVVFGSMEVVTVAFADESGYPGAAGAILAVQAFGSGAAGLAFGLLTLSGSPWRRFVRCVCAMAALMTLPLLSASVGGLWLLAPTLLLVGMAIAPTMVTSMTLVQELVPAARINEGMTLAVTALLCGISAGAAGGGWAAERLPGAWSYTLPLCAAATAAVVALLGGRAPARERAGQA
ncbi:MFS transporter [Streptomyces sp. P38-E01]|uniref:MFS transporter n=1 Tax=Streptomyces tardus TaxID=2780544 RepID=A0A949N8L6_9ACTN|nr:MFS transporter [Streptomyces tardus]MBU7598686.1 MFS transporter [Streptomyces tardus]